MTKQEFIESIALEGEEWRDVPGYESRYIVSSLGRVFSIKRQAMLSLVTQKSRGKDYICVCLSSNGIHEKVRVHRLVAQAFLSNPHHYSEVDHLDGNGKNNSVSNLKWCSHENNLNNPITLKRYRQSARKRRGEVGELKDRYIAQILNGEIIALYENRKQLIMAGFNDSRVYLVCKGKGITHKGYQWAYVDCDSPLISMSKNS